MSVNTKLEKEEHRSSLHGEAIEEFTFIHHHPHLLHQLHFSSALEQDSSSEFPPERSFPRSIYSSVEDLEQHLDHVEPRTVRAFHSKLNQLIGSAPAFVRPHLQLMTREQGPGLPQRDEQYTARRLASKGVPSGKLDPTVALMIWNLTMKTPDEVEDGKLFVTDTDLRRFWLIADRLRSSAKINNNTARSDNPDDDGNERVENNNNATDFNQDKEFSCLSNPNKERVLSTFTASDPFRPSSAQSSKTTSYLWTRFATATIHRSISAASAFLGDTVVLSPRSPRWSNSKVLHPRVGSALTRS